MPRVIKKLLLRQGAILGSALAVMSCAEGRVFQGGAVEVKPEAVQTFNAVAGTAAEESPILIGRYRAWVDAPRIGLKNLCQGELTLTIYAGGGVKPDGVLFCDVVGSQDLGAMMPKPEGAPEAFDPKRFPQFGMITRVPNPGAGQHGPRFDPPRPMFLGPLIQNPDVFIGFTHTEASRLSGTTADGSTRLDDHGEFIFQVHALKQTYTSPDMPGTRFDNVMEWSVTTRGFQKSRFGTMIFDEMRYHINLRPISIPRIQFRASVSDISPPDFEGAAMANRFLGPIEINMSVIEETRLK